MANELKPCPFCGNSNPQVQSNGMGDWFVICRSDDYSDKFCEAKTSDRNCESKEQAIAAWNTRPGAPVEGLGALPPMPETVDLRPMRDDNPDGYLESTNDWVGNNLKAVRWLVINHVAIREALRTRSQAEAIFAAERAKTERWKSLYGNAVNANADLHDKVREQIGRIENLKADAAAKVEQERLRFEGDLDKWMKTIGAGITGYQPEAYALMDLACQELVKRRADNAALTARVKELEQDVAKREEHRGKLMKGYRGLETQLAMAEKIAFEHGYVLACCNIVNLHDEPTIAHDTLSELGVTRQAVKAMNLSEFDMKALRKIERGAVGSPYAKANRKVRAALEVKP